MRESPTVSVIIPTYNCAIYLAESIESALAQTYRNVEIVVVDDGSTDHTQEVVQPFLPKVKYIRQNNRGLSVARNVGIQHADGTLLAFLDADDSWVPQKLLIQVQGFQQYPAAGLSFTDHEVFDDSGASRAPGFPGKLLTWFKRHQVMDTDIAYGTIYRVLLAGECVTLSSVIVTREAIEEVGLFDDEFKICQDVDLWLRIAKKYPVIGVGRVLSRYRYRPDSISGSADVRMFRWNEEILRVLEKHLRNEWIPCEFHPLVKSTLSQLWWNVGWTYFNQNRFKEARSLFMRCARYRPFNMKHWIYWICSFCPLPIIERIRLVKSLIAGLAKSRTRIVEG